MDMCIEEKYNMRIPFEFLGAKICYFYINAKKIQKNAKKTSKKNLKNAFTEYFECYFPIFFHKKL